jgi:hypothetical protein
MYLYFLLEVAIILGIIASSPAIINSNYYFPINVEDSQSEIHGSNEEHELNNNEINAHGSNNNNIINYITVSYWVGFFGLGAAMSSLIIYKWIGRHINKIQLVIYSITVLAVTTGLIHILLIQDHLKELLIYGVFFAGSGTALIAYGIIISKFYNRKIVYYLGIGGAITLITLYLFTRLIGVERVSNIDIITKIVEAILLFVLIYTLHTIKGSRQLTAKREQ